MFVAPDLKTESLVTQLRKLTFNMLKAANIEVCLDTGQFKEALLDTDRKFNIYRIAQEQCTEYCQIFKSNQSGFCAGYHSQIFLHVSIGRRHWNGYNQKSYRYRYSQY